MSDLEDAVRLYLDGIIRDIDNYFTYRNAMALIWLRINTREMLKCIEEEYNRVID